MLSNLSLKAQLETIDTIKLYLFIHQELLWPITIWLMYMSCFPNNSN